MSIKPTIPVHPELMKDSIEAESIVVNGTIPSIQRPTGLGLGLGLGFQEDVGTEDIEEEEYDVPETKNMLPPLPSAESSISLSTPRIDNGEFTPLTSPVKRIIKSNSNPDINAETTKSEILNYSPAINIQERFEVQLDLPFNESGSAPKTIEERIKLYEDVQKKEIIEFDKTLKNLKKSGWMTDKEILQLEDSKFNNFNKWESKIKNLKKAMKKLKIDNKTNEYFEKDSNLIVNSPSLQNLEEKFSNLEM